MGGFLPLVPALPRLAFLLPADFDALLPADFDALFPADFDALFPADFDALLDALLDADLDAGFQLGLFVLLDDDFRYQVAYLLDHIDELLRQIHYAAGYRKAAQDDGNFAQQGAFGRRRGDAEAEGGDGYRNGDNYGKGGDIDDDFDYLYWELYTNLNGMGWGHPC